MANDEVKVEDIEDTDDNIKDIEDTEETDWKAEAQKATEEARKQAGIAKRNATRLKKLRDANKEQPVQQEKKTGFDYGELAFLTAKGIPDEDQDYLLQEAKTTGKELKELLGFNYIKEELKSKRESRATQDAIPVSSKRAGNASRGDVDYWLTKINAGTATVADIPDFSLRSEVVKARRASAENNSHFTDNPIV